MKRPIKKTVCMLLVLVLCAGLLPAISVGASALTLAERQQGVVAAALAYYDKGRSVQYDGSTIQNDITRGDGGCTRSTNQVSPEYATPTETMFSVCSDFAHQVYWDSFRINLCGSAGANTTGTLVHKYKDTPMTVYYWSKETGSSNDAISEMLPLLQPGDVITSLHKGGGHTMVYVGDCLGDGKTYLCHCWGADIRKSRDRGFLDHREYGPNDTDIDKRYGVSQNETSKGGAIRLDECEPFLRKHYGGTSRTEMNALRPLVGFTESEYPLPAWTQYRMTHPRLAIDRYLNKTRFNSITTGETVTMTLKLSNSSKVAYTVPVTEKVPAGAVLKTPFEGAAVAGDTMTWNVELKAGEEKTFTAEYEITAKRGEKVIFEGGSVGDIPSNSIPMTVGGKKLTDAENAKLADIANGTYNQQLAAAGANASNLGNVVYQTILGLNVEMPEYQQVVKKLIKEVASRSGRKSHCFKEPGEVAAEDLTTYQMMVPQLWGGNGIWYEWAKDHCFDPRDMHLEPGDVIVRASSLIGVAPSDQLVYLGNGKYLSYDKTGKSYPLVEEPQFVDCLSKKCFYVLRPTLAYDDVHTLPALAAPVTAKEFKFTDVKESDWFYTYVKDLVLDGTVNGMTPTTFEPNGTLTYGQALKLIALAVGEPEPAKNGTHWASGYLALAKEKKWLTNTVNLDGTITRLALCRIAAKAKNLTEQPASNPFTDTDSKDVLALNKAGVINGMTATTFQPEGKLTRAQISKIIWTLRKV